MRALTIEQIATLADCEENVVRKDMRRGLLPAQDCDVVREWLLSRWKRRTRRMIREELGNG
jgi:hypothetical protein